MLITDSKKLKDIKAEFHVKFPYLKLEFYAGKHESHKPTPARQQLDAEKTIGEVRSIHVEGDMSIDPHLKVSTLENSLWENYGLNVQVFRRSGNLWLQTSASDDWTLAEQNRKGQHSEHAFDEMHQES